MAKPQVTLTLAGDESKLTQAFARVGESSKAMATSVGESSRTIAQESTDGFDRAAEGADNAEGKAQGFASTLTGTKDSMSGVAMVARGDYFNGFVMAGQGAADLAEGLNYTVIPAVKAVARGFIGQSIQTARATATTVVHRGAMIAGAVATNVMTVAQRALNLAMRMNPIGLVITGLFLLGAGLVLAYKKSATFRAIVQAALNGVKVAIGGVVVAAGKIWQFFQFLGPKIGGALKGVAEIITAPFRAAFAAVRSAWNNTIGGKGFTVPGWVPEIGGKGFSIPYFHTGGIVSGAMGSETMAVLKAGEQVTGGRNGGGATTVVLQSDGTRLGDLLVRLLKEAVKARGGDVQFVLGGHA